MAPPLIAVRTLPETAHATTNGRIFEAEDVDEDVEHERDDP